MHRTRFQFLLSLVLLAGLVLTHTPVLAAAPRAQQVPSPQGALPASSPQGVSLTSSGLGRPAPVALLFDPNAKPNRVDAPPLPAGGLSPQAASFVIDFVAAGSYNALGDLCGAFPSQAIPPFQAAAGIWAGLINSPVTIRIEACWASLPPGVLGHSATGNYFRDFPGAPVTGTWYPVALANSFYGSDLDPVPASKPAGCTSTTCPDSNWDDISIAYASAYTGSFYYGTDGNDGGLTDFESVVLHEMTHGLGFAGSVCVSGSSADWGCIGTTDTYPASYDRFTQNGASAILSFPHNSSALLAALTSNNVSFNGAHAQAANGGAPVALYAPAAWQGGSSYSHLGEIFNGTPNALMTYSIGVNEVLHSPGPVTLGLLNDIGWTLSSTLVVAAPSSLAAAPLSSTQVQLSWTSNGSGETGFLVERSPDGSTGWTSIATPAAPASSYTDTGVTEGKKYFYRVSETFPGPQSSSPSNVASAITPLLAPGGLAAAPASAAQVNLSWANNSSAATAYTVERSPNGSSAWTTLTTSAGLSAYSDTGLSEGSLYYYRVTATNAVPSSSAASSVASARTLLKPASGVGVTPVSSSQLNLSWTNNSALATAFTVERSPNGSSGWTTLTTAAGLTAYSDTSLAEGTTAFYRVTASNAQGQSAPVAAAAPATTYLNAPTGLLAAPVPGVGQIRIQWNDASALETGYQVQYATSAGGPWTNVTPTLPAGTTAYVWTAPNGTYFFHVRAVGATVNSLFSGPVSATLSTHHLFISVVR